MGEDGSNNEQEYVGMYFENVFIRQKPDNKDPSITFSYKYRWENPINFSSFIIYKVINYMKKYDQELNLFKIEKTEKLKVPKYKKIKKAGEGSFGEVYKIKLAGKEDFYALK